MIRRCRPSDRQTILTIINDAAEAYKGIIPQDRWHDPYMPDEELEEEIADGVAFWGCEEDGALVAVMGLQDKGEVSLIRHAYVRPTRQRQGIGARLLAHLMSLATTPLLVGTWADSTWAIAFYEKHGFRQVSTQEKDALLRQYWSIPERQTETSVVLAGRDWPSGVGAEPSS